MGVGIFLICIPSRNSFDNVNHKKFAFIQHILFKNYIEKCDCDYP